MNLTDPYLEAIQAVPGDTPTEKFQWMVKIIKNRVQAGDESCKVENWEEVPRPLAPLVNIEAAKMLKTYDAVTEALKSNDNFIVTKALKANWYFDGSNKDVTNVNYFFENIFPFVSVQTRSRIVRSLSRNLLRKEPKIAEEFFLALSDTYGIDQIVTRLLEACSESFAFDAIVRHNITLRLSALKAIYPNNPNLVIRYLKMLCYSKKGFDYDAKEFLPTLIKKNLNIFIEIVYHTRTIRKLTKKHATIFLKNAREEIEKDPQFYILILPLKLIDINLLESIFSKLFPEDINKFQTNQMLNYLQYYPENKKVLLLSKSYEERYGKNFLDNINNVTPNLLKMLPKEQRVEQARLLLVEKKSSSKFNKNYSTAWRCYLPADEAITAIKKDISAAKFEDDRIILVKEMIYTCKINDDNVAMLKVLRYCNNRHKNENASFWSRISDSLLEMYNIESFSEEHWNVIDEIIVRNHMKEHLVKHYEYNYRRLIEKALLYKLKNNLPFDQMIEIFADLDRKIYNNNWSILHDYPEYELKCFEAAYAVIKTRFESDNTKWLKEEIEIVEKLLNEIYDYNKRQKKLKTGRDKLSLKNYPWLMQKVESILLDESKKDFVDHIKFLLIKNEKDLCEKWFTVEKKTETKIEKFDFGKALSQMKKNPKNILDNYKKYLDNYLEMYEYKTRKRILWACRWYKDIPIVFANEALQRLETKKQYSYLRLLGALLHGDTYTKLIDPHIPTEKSIDVKNKDALENYCILADMLGGMLQSSPPVSVELLDKLCNSDYLPLALGIIRNICNRTSVITVQIFADSLTKKKVSVRKHGIRFMCMILPIQQNVDFLLSQWKTEKHHSIREVIFKKFYKLFQKKPRSTTWSGFKECFLALKLTDWSIMQDNQILFYNFPSEYIIGLISIMVQIINNFVAEGLDKEEAMQYLNRNFQRINSKMADDLSDDFCEEIIKKYLFDPNTVSMGFMKDFLLSKYLFLRNDKIDSRMAGLSRVLENAVKTGWDIPHPQKEHFYPVNYTVHAIMQDIAKTYILTKNPVIIKHALNIYNDFLAPEMDISNYFLFILAKEYAESSSMKEFTRNVGQKLPELLEKYTPYYPICFVFTLRTLIQMIHWNDEEIELTVMETLLECPSHYAHLVAVSNLPTIRNSANVPRYDALIEKLKNHDNPAIRSIIYLKINTDNFDNCCINS